MKIFLKKQDLVVQPDISRDHDVGARLRVFFHKRRRVVQRNMAANHDVASRRRDFSKNGAWPCNRSWPGTMTLPPVVETKSHIDPQLPEKMIGCKE